MYETQYLPALECSPVGTTGCWSAAYETEANVCLWVERLICVYQLYYMKPGASRPLHGMISVSPPVWCIFWLDVCISLCFSFATFINCLTAYPRAHPLCPLLVVISVSAPAWVYLLPPTPTYQQLLMQFKCACQWFIWASWYMGGIWEVYGRSSGTN